MNEITDSEDSEESHAAADAIDAALITALPAAGLSPGVTALLAGALPARMMAARGIAPLRPADLAVALFQLSFDADENIRKTAEAAPGALPENLVLSIVKEPLPAPVLHFFGSRLPEHRGAAIEALLFNQHTPDATFVALARRLEVTQLDIICQNEARLLRCPAIVKRLFENPATRMSSVNRAIELCARNNVVVEIPAYQEIVNAIREDADATTGTRDDLFNQTTASATREVTVDFDALLAEEDKALSKVLERSPTAQIEDLDGLLVTDIPILDDEVEADPVTAAKDPKAKEKKKKSTIIDFSRLRIFEKIRLATFGNQYCRTNLIRDPNRLVAMATIRSPKITDKEIIAIASSKAVHSEVIRYLANSRTYLKMAAIRRGLVLNPKCPLQQAIRLLPSLTHSDIKKISTSKSVPTALATSARRIVQAKEKNS